jgi:hypothetical protein
MPTRWQLDCLRVRIVSLRSDIERVDQKDHPYPEPGLIYRALVEVINARSDLLEDSVQLYSLENEKGSRKLHETFESIAQDMQEIARVFNWASRVDSARIPFEILRSLSWVAKHVLGTRCDAVVYLDPDYDYSILSCRRIFESMNWERYWDHVQTSLLADDHSTVLLLGFPSPDAGSILVHALAAHEFGHELAYRSYEALLAICERRVAEAKVKYDSDLQDYISAWAYKREVVAKGEAYEPRRVNVSVWLEEIAEHWLVEVFSDLVAARLVGPAFLAALDRILLGLGTPTYTHPPTDLRRDIVRKYLQKILPHVVEDPVWKPLFIDNRGTDTRDLLWRIGRDICLSSFEELSTILESIPTPLNDTGNLSELNEMHEYIDHLAPPSVPLNINGKMAGPDSFWLIMYGAWHYRLGPRFEKFAESCGSKNDLAKAESALGNLVLQALHSLELHYRWNRSQTPYNGGGAYVS